MKPPTTIHFFDREILQVAQEWNDLTLDQLLALYALISDAFFRGASVAISAENRTIMLIRLLSISKSDIEAWEQARIVEFGQEDGSLVFLSELDELLHVVTDPLFLFSPNTEFTIEPRLTLTRCPYPELSGSDRPTLYAPADGFQNMTIYELGTVFTLYDTFIKDQTSQNILELLATIFRPGKPATDANIISGFEGDIRLPLRRHESTIPQRIEIIAELPHLVRGLLMFWVAGCRAAIIEQFPNLFKPATQPEESVATSAGNDYGWAGLLMSLADGLVHLDAIADQPWQNAFIYLSKIEDERKLAEFRARQRK